MKTAAFSMMIALAITLGFAGVNAAYAQGIMVKPMRMDVSGRAGQTLKIPLELRNTAGEGANTLDLRIVDLSQNSAGQWQIIEPGGNVDTSHLATAAKWVEVSDSSVEIESLSVSPVTVSVKLPSDAQGTYFAGVLVQSRADPAAEGVRLRMSFLIPLIVSIEGRPVRQQVSLADVGMAFINTNYDELPADLRGGRENRRTTVAAMSVVNEGRTYSRVHGKLRIERRNGESWRLVTRFDIPERGIIPGVTLKLGDDLQRRLPSGIYRLRGELNVDGRQLKPLEKEIEFEGDPDVDTLAFDTALVLKPEFVEMKIAPGAMRTATVSIENPSDDPVIVRIKTATPSSLQGVVMGELRGDAFSAAPWTEVRPAEFNLRPRGRQNVRIMSRVPSEGVDHPHYYADLILQGIYADGQSAGETRSMVHLAHAGVNSTPNGLIEHLSLSEGEEPSRYIAQMHFTNIGNTHTEPAAKVSLVNSRGGEIWTHVLSGEEGMLLPMGQRRYGGELSFAGVEPGYYTLRATVEIAAGRSVTKQNIVQVKAEEHLGADGVAATVYRVTVLASDSEDIPKDMNLQMGDGPPIPVDQQIDSRSGGAG